MLNPEPVQSNNSGENQINPLETSRAEPVNPPLETNNMPNDTQPETNLGGPIEIGSLEKEDAKPPLNSTFNGGEMKKRDFIRIIFIALSAIFLVSSAALGYLYLEKDKSYKEQKSIVEKKSNCEVCAQCPITKEEEPVVPVETPAPAAPTTTKKSTTSNKSTTTQPAQEEVIAPPLPPSD